MKKWGDVEGAGAFAAFVPTAYRKLAVVTLGTFQTIYDYTDNVSEQPAYNRQANSHQLHEALRLALGAIGAHPDYYAQSPERADNGYLEHLVDATRQALAGLPSHALIAPYTQSAAERIVFYQGLNHTENERDALASWGAALAPRNGLAWWEACAAAGSSLDILALIAAAADIALTHRNAKALAHAYFPWVGAFHTLLDSLIDYREDHATGQHSLLDAYPGNAALASRMRHLATEALKHLDDLPRAYEHRLLFTAMSCLYLSDKEASAPHVQPTRSQILQILDRSAIPALPILMLQRYSKQAPSKKNTQA
jgi:tetraprenyl-beta-curcumene synthase